MANDACTALERQLWEINLRIAVWQLQSQTTHLQNQIDKAYGFAKAYAAQRLMLVLTTPGKILVNPVAAPQTAQQAIQDAAKLEQSILASLKSAQESSQQLETARTDLSRALDESPSVTGIDYGNVTLGDLEKQRDQIEDALLRCYSDNNVHLNGLPHDWEAEVGPLSVCWCGQNHGRHNFLGLTTCWCGRYNDYIGHPR